MYNLPVLPPFEKIYGTAAQQAKKFLPTPQDPED